MVSVVEDRDRLARVGVECLHAPRLRGAAASPSSTSDTTEDLVRDMIEVLTSKGARLYGSRRAGNCAMRAVIAAQWQPDPVAVW